MRIAFLVIASLLIGSGAGLGLTAYEFSAVQDDFSASYSAGPNQVPYSPDTPQPRAVVVGEKDFDFGTLERYQSDEKVFVIRNESVVNMEVELSGVSCGHCIKTDVPLTVVGPEAELEIKIRYTTHKPGPEFAEYAEVRTTDPNNPLIRFAITGRVSRAIGFSVGDELLLGNISVTEPTSVEFKMFAYRGDSLEVEHYEFTSPGAGQNMDVEFKRLEPDQLSEDDRATVGMLVTLKLNEGLPLGPLERLLRITARTSEKQVIAELPIRGMVVSDLLLLGGRDFRRDRNLLRLRTIKRGVGAKTLVRVRVKGPHRHDVKLSVGDIDPPTALAATIGEPTVLENDQGYLYPITVEVKKDALPLNRLGSEQGKTGRIMIETTHPDARQLPIYVSFAID